jgi:hypothetical protein
LWVEALLSAAEVEGQGVATVWNLQALASLAKMQAMRTPENIAKALADQKGARRTSLKKALPDSESNAAMEVARAAFERSKSKLADLVATEPHQVARMVCGGSGDWDKRRESWSGVGLEAVDAKKFLYAPWMTYKTGGVRSIATPQRQCWPRKSDVDCPSLDGETLTFVDCAALSGASREDLESMMAAGHYPTKGLAACLAGHAKLSWGGESAELWMVSVAQNANAPLGKGGPRL